MRLPPGPQLRRDLEAALEEAGENAAAGALAALERHLALLAAWNDRYHLTAVTEWREVCDRHVRESLLPLRWIGTGGSLLDIGTGNGFPAIPILACRPGLEGLLVERSEKKSLFLDAVVREGGLARVRILTADLSERTGEQARGPFDYVVSRATLAPDRYLALARARLRRGGRAFLFAGADRLSAGEEPAGDLRILAREPIAGRRDSYLFVLEA